MKLYSFIYLEYRDNEVHAANLNYFIAPNFSHIPGRILSQIPKTFLPRRGNAVYEVESRLKAANDLFVDGFLKRVKPEIKGSTLDDITNILKKKETHIILRPQQYTVLSQAMETLKWGRVFVWMAVDHPSTKQQVTSENDAPVDWEAKYKELEKKYNDLKEQTIALQAHSQASYSNSLGKALVKTMS